MSSVAQQPLFIDRCQFDFDHDGREEAVKAVNIYRNLILRPQTISCSGPSANVTVEGRATLRRVQISFNDTAIRASEAYGLTITTRGSIGAAFLTVASSVGLIRGLETISQLLQEDSPGSRHLVSPASVVIMDEPAFAHRGILLDTARNFLPVPHCLTKP